MISNEEPNDDFKHLESTLTYTLVGFALAIVLICLLIVY